MRLLHLGIQILSQSVTDTTFAAVLYCSLSTCLFVCLLVYLSALLFPYISITLLIWTVCPCYTENGEYTLSYYFQLQAYHSLEKGKANKFAPPQKLQTVHFQVFLMGKKYNLLIILVCIKYFCKLNTTLKWTNWALKEHKLI